MRRLIGAIGLGCVMAIGVVRAESPAAIAGVSQIDPLIEQAIQIPSEVPGVFGTRRYMLEAVLVRPPSDRRLPLAVITHGTPREAADRRKQTPATYVRVARDFARRGWIAVVVMRRGHGASEGEYEEGMQCANPDYVRSGRMAVHDLKNTVRYMSEQSYVDGSHVIGIGHSTGGFSWLAVAADPPPNLKAVINFAGGHGSMRPYENCSENQMLLAMRTFGSSARFPSLWIYSENDTYIVPDFARRMHGAFTAAGAPAQLHIVAPFEQDGHNLPSRAAGSYVWTPLVDAFLRQQGLSTWAPSEIRYDLVPPTRRAHFERYLGASGEKAIAVSLDGTYDYWFYARATAEDAKHLALEKCEDGQRQCRILAVNFAVLPP
jgi:dienelactone hydrolase